MNTFFESNPGMASRIAHHIAFQDYTAGELFEIAEKMLGEWNYRFDPAAAAAFKEYLTVRRERPHFANGRSVRNALDRIRLRQALRLFEERDGALTPEDLQTIREPEVRASRLFDSDCEDTDDPDSPDATAPTVAPDASAQTPAPEGGTS
jgi:hypothetical protein